MHLPRPSLTRTPEPLLRRPVAMALIVSSGPGHEHVVVAGAVAAQHLDLQHVERVEVGEAVGHAAGQHRVVGQVVGQPVIVVYHASTRRCSATIVPMTRSRSPSSATSSA